MKKIVFFLAFVCLCMQVIAQQTFIQDTIPAYLKTKQLPAFTLVTDIKKKDTTWFTQNNIPANKPIIIIYFSPECGHCELEAKEIVKHMDSLRKAYFVFASYHPVDKIQAFAEKYYLNKFSNITVGRDIQYFIPVFFKVKFTPFVAVYNGNRNLLKVYEQGSEMNELIQLVNQ